MNINQGENKTVELRIKANSEQWEKCDLSMKEKPQTIERKFSPHMSIK